MFADLLLTDCQQLIHVASFTILPAQLARLISTSAGINSWTRTITTDDAQQHCWDTQMDRYQQSSGDPPLLHHPCLSPTRLLTVWILHTMSFPSDFCHLERLDKPATWLLEDVSGFEFAEGSTIIRPLACSRSSLRLTTSGRWKLSAARHQLLPVCVFAVFGGT